MDEGQSVMTSDEKDISVEISVIKEVLNDDAIMMDE